MGQVRRRGIRAATIAVVGLVGTIATTTATAAPATGADRRAPAGSYVTTFLPTAAADVPGAPTILPTVDCLERRDRVDTFWFGYDDTATIAGLVLADTDDNVFAELAADGSPVTKAVNAGQIEHFRPGAHRRAFGVTVPSGHRLRWTLVSRDTGAGGTTSASWRVELTTVRPPGCDGAPRRSATVQTTQQPAIVTKFGGVATDPLGTVTFRALGVTSACDAGGEPLDPVVLWGFDDTAAMSSFGINPDVPRDGFVPVAAADVVRVDTFGSGTRFVRTRNGTRTVVDPQRVWSSPYSGTDVRGLAVTNVLADVYGACRYGRRTVVGTEPLWIRVNGFPDLDVFVTNDAGDGTVALGCLGQGLGTCPVVVNAGPGGSRWR